MYLPLELVKKNKNCRILPNEIDTEKEKSMLNTQCTFQNILHFFLIKKKTTLLFRLQNFPIFFFFIYWDLNMFCQVMWSEKTVWSNWNCIPSLVWFYGLEMGRYQKRVLCIKVVVRWGGGQGGSSPLEFEEKIKRSWGRDIRITKKIYC